MNQPVDRVNIFRHPFFVVLWIGYGGLAGLVMAAWAWRRL